MADSESSDINDVNYNEQALDKAVLLCLFQQGK